MFVSRENFHETNLHLVGDNPSILYSSVGSPGAQVHDSPQRLFRLLRLLLSHQSVRNHGRRGRREVPGRLRTRRADLVLGMLMNRSHCVIPYAEALILERLHCSHTCRHDPSFPHLTHLLNFLNSE